MEKLPPGPGHPPVCPQKPCGDQHLIQAEHPSLEFPSLTCHRLGVMPAPSPWLCMVRREGVDLSPLQRGWCGPSLLGSVH